MMALRNLNGARYDLIEVAPDGRARVLTEKERVAEALARVKARSAVPAACGDEIPLAPARGPMVEFTPREVVQTDTGGYRFQRSGYAGRNGARVADAFDLMTLQAKRQHPRAVKAALAAHPQAVAVAQIRHECQAVRAHLEGRKIRAFSPPEFVPPAFVAPFTQGQVQMARVYAALSERVSASGVKCSSLEAVNQSGGGGGDREAAMLRDFDALRVLHRRIGHGVAKEIRRIRPGGRKRRAIYVRRLVDAVCLGGATMDDVLEAHGWAVDQKSREGIRAALCGALDRMQGYDLSRDHKRG